MCYGCVASGWLGKIWKNPDHLWGWCIGLIGKKRGKPIGCWRLCCVVCFDWTKERGGANQISVVVVVVTLCVWCFVVLSFRFWGLLLGHGERFYLCKVRSLLLWCWDCCGILILWPQRCVWRLCWLLCGRCGLVFVGGQLFCLCLGGGEFLCYCWVLPSFGACFVANMAIVVISVGVFGFGQSSRMCVIACCFCISWLQHGHW